MQYFQATVLTQGKKKAHGFYAKDRKDATDIAKIKYSGLLIKVEESVEPFDLKIKRIKA